MTCVITGGSSGLGYEIAKKLYSICEKVIIIGRNEDELINSEKEFKVYCE